MKRVERCYRSLIRLLPAQERAGRGAELLGLLLDLEEDREWPSVQETGRLLGLAARLHLRRLALLPWGMALLGAYFMAVGCATTSQVLGYALDPGAGAAFASVDAWLVLFCLLQLAVAVSWLRGAYRVTLILVGVLVICQIDELRTVYIPGAGFQFFLFQLGGIGGLIWTAATCLLVPALLIAAIRRAPARASRPVGLAGFATALAVQTVLHIGAGASGLPLFGALFRHLAGYLLIAACAATAGLCSRRRRSGSDSGSGSGSGSGAVVRGSVLAGLVGGWALSLVVPSYFAVILALVLCAGEAGHLVAARRARRARPDGIAVGTA